MLKKIFHKMFDKAYKLRRKIILDFLNQQVEAKLLDLGCDEGTWTLKIADKVNTKNIYGVDIVEQRLKDAEGKGIRIIKADLNESLPFKDDFFDVIHADQVIEHIAFLDKFVSEIYRVLKPGGYVIIGTENGSSWHNIFASILGWQIFSLTNISSKQCGIGNPLAIHRNENVDLDSWIHKTIFNYRGIKEFFELYKFKDTTIMGAGYYPLPAIFGKIDVRHSHFIVLKCFK